MGTSPGQDSDFSSTSQTAQVEIGGIKSRVILGVSVLVFHTASLVNLCGAKDSPCRFFVHVVFGKITPNKRSALASLWGLRPSIWEILDPPLRLYEIRCKICNLLIYLLIICSIFQTTNIFISLSVHKGFQCFIILWDPPAVFY